jgi:hypothetical protein
MRGGISAAPSPSRPPRPTGLIDRVEVHTVHSGVGAGFGVGPEGGPGLGVANHLFRNPTPLLYSDICTCSVFLWQIDGFCRHALLCVSAISTIGLSVCLMVCWLVVTTKCLLPGRRIRWNCSMEISSYSQPLSSRFLSDHIRVGGCCMHLYIASLCLSSASCCPI